MSEELNLGRDHQSLVDYALSLVGVRKYNNNFAAGDETFIELESGDKTAIFFPGVGANYRISNATNGVIPSTPGAAMQQVNTTQNIAAVQLDDWLDSGSGKRIYILSADIQTMTVLVYK